MSNTAIIAEYNPFHNGHKYLIDTAKYETNSRHIFAIMSGNFVQRGSLSICSKYDRAAAAINGGLSAVFELPAYYALGSARDFAQGSIQLLNATRSVDYLAFGVENKDNQKFDQFSDLLAKESQTYQFSLREKLAKGISFPKARASALIEILGEEVREFITLPNNNLALSYMVALKQSNSSIKPIMIERKNVAHHSKVANENFASASYIRTNIMKGLPISSFIPEESYQKMASSLESPLSNSDQSYLSLLISQILLDGSLEDKNIWELSPDFARRLNKIKKPFLYEELCEYCHTKNLTRTHVERVLMHLILGMKESEANTIKANGLGYLNLLALDNQSSDLIKEMKENSELSIITKKAAYKPLSQADRYSWAMDKKAVKLYQNLLFYRWQKYIPSELESTVVTNSIKN